MSLKITIDTRTNDGHSGERYTLTATSIFDGDFQRSLHNIVTDMNVNSVQVTIEKHNYKKAARSGESPRQHRSEDNLPSSMDRAIRGL